MNGQYRRDIRPGLRVAIIRKQDQRTGKRTVGVVKDILTLSRAMAAMPSNASSTSSSTTWTA